MSDKKTVSGVCVENGIDLSCEEVSTDPLHVEGERLPASGFGLVPAQHHVGVAHLAGVDICGRERNFDLT